MKLKAIALWAHMILVLPFWSPLSWGAKSDSCAHCHGVDGNSSGSAFPSLAGQTREYLYRQIKAFKEGIRKDPMMSPAATVLTDADMLELADYYSNQTLVRSTYTTDPTLVAEGKKIAADMACVSCHQPGFKGLNEFPRLSRQKFSYLVKQLKDYRAGTRINDNGIMAAIAKPLTDEQIKALAQYLTGL